jgi:hypothetical protein
VLESVVTRDWNRLEAIERAKGTPPAELVRLKAVWFGGAGAMLQAVRLISRQPGGGVDQLKALPLEIRCAMEDLLQRHAQLQASGATKQ